MAFVSPTAASAQLAIDRLWVDFDAAGTPRSDLVIRNESDDKYYITVSTTEVTDPGTSEEQRVAIADPEVLGLLVTPNRIILNPSEIRAIRIVSLNKNVATDRVYRVNVTPQIGELSVSGNDDTNRGLAIKMLAAFDVLVTVRPAEKRTDFRVTRSGDFLKLENIGNSNILLLDGEICPVTGSVLSAVTQFNIAEQEKRAAGTVTPQSADQAEPASPSTRQESRIFEIDACVGLPARRLYAENSWLIPASYGEALRFNRRDSAAKDLEPITIRCDTGGPDGQDQNSEYCFANGSEAVPEGQI